MPESRRNQIILLALLLAAGTAVLYAPAVRNGFVNYDDPDYVTRNPNVLRGLTWQNVTWAFGTENPAANWHPLTWMSHMLDVTFYGSNPAGHHVTNVILHCLGVVLLFLFLERATAMPLRSAAVAALFALHPLNVESVAWVAERKAVLCMVFIALALSAYVWYAKKPGPGRYALVAALFALALMSKVMVITLPFALILLDYWPLTRIPELAQGESLRPFLSAFGKMVVEKTPLFAMAAAAGWLTLHVHRSAGALAGAMPFVWRLKNAVYSYLWYLGKAVWPSDLAVFYPHPGGTLAWWRVAVAALGILAISAMVWRFREKRYLLVGWLWFLGTMVPMGGIVQSGRQGMADRYIYIPILGLLIAVVWLLGDFAARFQLQPGAAVASFALLATPYAYVTDKQIAYWQDSLALFGHALEVTKNNAVAENNFGQALMENKRPDLAAPHLQAAVRLAPELASAHYNLAVLLQRASRTDDAAREYHLALTASSDPLEMAQAHNNLGILYLDANNFPAALTELNAAIALNPGEQNSYIARGVIELRSWNLDAAVADFSQAAQIAPSPIANFHLGQALETKGDYPRAELAYVAALQLSPGLTEARVRLAALRNNTSGGSPLKPEGAR
jgi:protein O-mannosyl-transferase